MLRGIVIPPVILSIFAFAAAEAAPAAKTYCGTRTGSFGNAALSRNDGGDVIVLATQGGDQTLLDQADELVPKDPSGEIGTQNGTYYCVTAELDSSGKPVKITRAWRPQHN